ncbi:UxaA family hydrolase [Rhodococcus pseudokoreensis]|uniref:UxaA family hydrolase n=1 Tax=Rhodococcus pseudokoreensis TaxID=2811421 RepID=A0A974ZVL2_9NOCA|nr:UxaA family hydrolase [Rhodococcus pseudokoreensis]QSE92151.1 UxaA family hydrolase [Rhodococcus pseudokoreensis]
MKTELMGFLRPDGRWGYRDHTLVVPVHSALCKIAADVAESTNDDIVAIRHEWDSPRDHADQARVLAALLGFATHPNVGATLILGVGDEVELFEQALTAAEKPHRVVRLDRADTFDGLESSAKAALAELLGEKVPAVRQPAPLSSLCLGLECGSSDAFSGITANPALGVASDRLVEAGGTSILAEITELLGAEHLLAKRAVSDEVARQIIEVVARFEKDVARIGVDLLGSQPAPGNIAGGLTTIEEKSMGAARKGGTGPISGVVEYAESPPGPGLYIMDTPGQDIEQMVAMVAGGAQIVAFTTGLGTPTGSPIAPCLKISSNSEVAKRLPELIDIDAGTILTGTPIDEIGQRILDELIEVASGRHTKAESRGNHEFALSFIRPTGM